MSGSNEIERRNNEYSLLVPKVPRQSVEVFARDTEHGNYGLPAEVVDTLFEYAQLQQTLSSFDALTFSAEFLARLPEDFRKKLDQNLYPGIPLTTLEIPTTDKVLLAELLTADALTTSLSQTYVDVWITPSIQEKLKPLNCPVEKGLQHIDYGQLSLEAKHFLVSVMEYQEMQVHTILLAHERFPEGVPAISGFRALLAPEGEIRTVQFGALEDLEGQYIAAQNALKNPLQLLIGQIVQKMRAERSKAKDVPPQEIAEVGRKKWNERPFNVEQEAQEMWWNGANYGENYSANRDAVVEYLRPQYEQKTLYEIFGADTYKARQEVLSAFWRRRGSKHVDLGDEGWIEHNLYLRPDGNLEVHHWDDLYDDRRNVTVTGKLRHYRDVAMIDQAVKWIRQEQDTMRAVKEKWNRNGLSETQSVECTLVRAIDQSLSGAAQEEINGLPKWFVDALNQETQYYSRLPIEYVPLKDIDDLLFSLPFEDEQPRNLLKSYFVRSQHDLLRYRGFLTTPEELYKVLGLDASATQDQVKDAYRKIAKETRAIHISSPDEFDEAEWSRMNQRFTEATRAYKALTKHPMGDARITTLGRISSYFVNE